MANTVETDQPRDEIEKMLGLNTSSPTGIFGQWSRLQLGIAATAVAAFSLVLYWLFGGQSNQIRYITEPVAQGSLTVIVTATGSVQPTNKVDVSSELSGTIRKVLADYNSKVKVGQVLAELDTDKLRASVESARAKLVAARAKIKDAEATVVEKRLEYERKLKLMEKKVTSEQDLQATRAAFARSLATVESAKADAAAAEADLKLNQTNLAKTCICSPINGVVLARNVEPGQIVASSLQAPVLFTIAEDLTKMEVQVNVDEADVGKVREAQKAIFTVDAYPERKFEAKIRELRFGSEVTQSVVTYKAILTTENGDLLLRPGMTATAEITVRRIVDAITVPNEALRYTPPAKEAADRRSFIQRILPGRPTLRAPSAQAPTGSQRTIWVVADGESHPVNVTIGATDGRRTEIVKGDLKPGQKVIVDNAATAK